MSSMEAAETRTPLFSKCDPQSGVTAILDNAAPTETLESRPGVILPRPAASARDSRIRYVRDCHLLRQRDKIGWRIDGVTINSRNLLQADFKGTPRPTPTLLASALALIFSAGLLAHRLRRTRRDGKSSFSWDSPSIFAALAGIVALRIFLAETTLLMAGDFILDVNDERRYFASGTALLREGDIGPCVFTLGNCLIHGVFALLLNADCYEGIAIPLSCFNAFITSPLACACAFLVARGVLCSIPASLGVSLLSALYPFAVQISARGVDFISLPVIEEYSDSLYFWADLVGYNALSDTPNLLAALLAFAAALRLFPLRSVPTAPATILKAALAGAALGAIGMIRPSNICLAPAFAFLVARPAIEIRSPRLAVRLLCALGAGMLVGFAPQLIANHLQSGSILTLPYHLYHTDATQKGFQLSILPLGAPFFFNASSILLSLGAAGGLFLNRQAERIFVLLAVFPLLIFYSGYANPEGDPVRFILPIIPFLTLLAQRVLCRAPLAALTVLAVAWILKNHAGSLTVFAVGMLLAPAAAAACVFAICRLARIGGGIKWKSNLAVMGIIAVSEVLITLGNAPGLTWSTLLFAAAAVALWLSPLGITSSRSG